MKSQTLGGLGFGALVAVSAALGCGADGGTPAVDDTAGQARPAQQALMPEPRTGAAQAEPISAAVARPSVAANRFELSGGDLRIVYTSSQAPSGAELLYQNARGQVSTTFRGSDVLIVPTPAGDLVSVFIHRSVDSGSSSVSILVPRVAVEPNGSASVATQAITAFHQFNVDPRRESGQLDDYAFTPLQGTAADAQDPVVRAPSLAGL